MAQTLVTAYWGNRGLYLLLTADQARQAGVEQGGLVSAVLVVLGHAGVFSVTARWRYSGKAAAPAFWLICEGVRRATPTGIRYPEIRRLG